MKKLSFKLAKEQLSMLSDLTTQYIEEIEWKDVRGHWMRHSLFSFIQRLDAQHMKCVMNRKPTAKVSIPVGECFAFVLLYDKHPIEPTNYLDNIILQMLNAIKQHYV